MTVKEIQALGLSPVPTMMIGLLASGKPMGSQVLAASTSTSGTALSSQISEIRKAIAPLGMVVICQKSAQGSDTFYVMGKLGKPEAFVPEAEPAQRVRRATAVPPAATATPVNRKRAWIRSEVAKLRRLRTDGMTKEQIAVVLGRSVIAVRTQLIKMGLPSTDSGRGGEEPRVDPRPDPVSSSGGPVIDLARLKMAMTNAGETNSSLARALGVETNSVSNWLNGHRKIATGRIPRLAEVLGVDPSFFMTIKPVQGGRLRGRSPIGTGHIDPARLQLAMQLAGFTHEHVAVALGLTPGAVLGWLNGKRAIGMDRAPQLAEVLRIDPSFFMIKSDGQPAQPGRKRVVLLRLREALERSPVSQREIGEAMGISNQAISQWLSGKRRVPLGRVAHLAKLTGVEESFFFSDRASAKPVAQPSPVIQQPSRPQLDFDTLAKAISGLVEHAESRPQPQAREPRPVAQPSPPPTILHRLPWGAVIDIASVSSVDIDHNRRELVVTLGKRGSFVRGGCENLEEERDRLVEAMMNLPKLFAFTTSPTAIAGGMDPGRGGGQGSPAHLRPSEPATADEAIARMENDTLADEEWQHFLAVWWRECGTSRLTTKELVEELVDEHDLLGVLRERSNTQKGLQAIIAKEINIRANDEGDYQAFQERGRENKTFCWVTERKKDEVDPRIHGVVRRPNGHGAVQP